MKTFFITCLTVILTSTTILANQVEKLIVLGSGPAGLTAAIFAGQLALNPLVIEGDQDSGQVSALNRIENFPGFPEGIEGSELRERMRYQAENFGARFYPSDVIEADLRNYPFYLKLSDGRELFCESLIVASGASPKKLGLEKDDYINKGYISFNARKDFKKSQDKDIIVVGGGDAAMEQAIWLGDQGANVTIVNHHSSFLGSDYLRSKISSHPKIRIFFDGNLMEILENEIDKRLVIAIQKIKTNQIEEVECHGIVIAVGRKPNTSTFSGQIEMNEEGYLITKPGSTQTSVPGVFAAGDIALGSYRKMITAASSGCMSALDAKRFIEKSLSNSKLSFEK